MNAALLKVEQFLLHDHSTVIQPSMMEKMLTHCDRQEDAMGYLLCAALGLHLDNPANQTFLQKRLLPSLHLLRADAFRQTPYHALLANREGCCGTATLQNMQYAAYELFPCGNLWLEDGALRAPLGFFDESYSYPALLKEEREWMTLTPNEILTMEEPLQNLHGNVLVYGLGLGYYAYQALCQPAVRSVTVVDNDPDIIALFHNVLLPLWNRQLHEVMPFAEGGRLTILHDDAFHHAESTQFACANGSHADIVFTDLWHDAGDGLPLYKQMRRLAHTHQATTDFRYWIEPTLQYYLGYGM